MARVLDGEWVVTGDVLQLLTGPSWSRDRLRALVDDLSASRTAAAAWDLVQRDAPDVAAAVAAAAAPKTRELSKEERVLLWVAVLLQVLQLVLQAGPSTSAPVTPEQIDEIVERTLEGYDDSPGRPTSTPASSTPPAPDERRPGRELGPST